MKKTMIAPGIGQVANSQKKENKNTPAWVKKIKSTEVGAFALGLAAYNLLFVKIKNGLPFFEAEETIIETESSEIPTQETVNGIIEENAQVATTVTDDMSFGEAFQASREELGPGNFFWWKGRFYNNYQEEEWNNLTEAEQASFVQQAGNFDEEDMAMDDTMETETTSDADSRVTVEEPAEHPAETLEDNHFSEQNNQQQMEYLDTNNDGKDDSLLINMDDDQQAEVVQTWVDGVNYALVDTGNTGMLDTIWMIDEEGNPYDPMPLAEEIPAPKLSREQHLDLLGNDGVIDSLAIDNRGDDRADQVFVDMNSDGIPSLKGMKEALLKDSIQSNVGIHVCNNMNV